MINSSAPGGLGAGAGGGLNGIERHQAQLAAAGFGPQHMGGIPGMPPGMALPPHMMPAGSVIPGLMPPGGLPGMPRAMPGGMMFGAGGAMASGAAFGAEAAGLIPGMPLAAPGMPRGFAASGMPRGFAAPGMPRGIPGAAGPRLPGMPLAAPGMPRAAPAGIPGMIPRLAQGMIPVAMALPPVTPVPTDPVLVEKNKKLLDTLLPLISKKIDANGGVMKICDLQPMPDVVKILKEIPNGFPKVLQKILLQWTDFFVNMPDGLVGTAMGYETGMIRDDGTLDPAYASMFHVSKRSVISNMTPLALPAAQVITREITAGNEKVELHAAAEEVWKASLDLKADAALVSSFHHVLRIRSVLRSGVAGSVSKSTSKTAMVVPKPSPPTRDPLPKAGSVPSFSKLKTTSSPVLAPDKRRKGKDLSDTDALAALEANMEAGEKNAEKRRKLR